MSKLSDNIRRYRELRKLSPADLARKSSTSPANISRYESDTIENPSMEIVAKIAKGLGVTPSELLGEEITSREVIDWIKSHDLTNDERDLVEAYRAMGPLEALGILAFVTEQPDHMKRLEEALEKASGKERESLARKLDQGLGAVREES